MRGPILGMAGVLCGVLGWGLGGDVSGQTFTAQTAVRGGFAIAAPPVPANAPAAGNGSGQDRTEEPKDQAPAQSVAAPAPIVPPLSSAHPGRVALAFPDWIDATYPYPVRPAPGMHDPWPGMWGEVAYLLCWVRPGPLGIPLVTTSDRPGTRLAGAVSQPQTHVLFGGPEVDYGPFSGTRVTLGTWLDAHQRFGVEGRGFLLESRAGGLFAASDAAGNPPLYVPAFSINLARERPLVVADPTVPRVGSLDLLLRTQLWGAEASGIWNLLRREQGSIDLLGGFRFLSLDENFRLDTSSTLLSSNANTIIRDHFDTSNRFYGPQFGARGVYCEGPLLLAATAKVALGSTHEAVNVSGDTTRGSDRTTPRTTQGGFLTQASNLGRHTADRFGLVPEGELQLGYQLPHGITAQFGYQVLYWSQVARVSDQIDPELNLTQSSVFGTGKRVGAARPATTVHFTDFWVHGLTFTLRFDY